MFKNLMYVALIGMLLVSCGKVTNSNGKDTLEIAEAENLPVSLKKVALNIEGMTCEIGCARTIQSKLSKTKGIKNAVVNFDNKEGIVEYDSNKISEDKIVAVVHEIAGGELYKVTEIKTVKISSEE